MYKNSILCIIICLVLSACDLNVLNGNVNTGSGDQNSSSETYERGGKAEIPIDLESDDSQNTDKESSALEEENDTLKKEISDLEDANKALKADLQALKNEIDGLKNSIKEKDTALDSTPDEEDSKPVQLVTLDTFNQGGWWGGIRAHPNSSIKDNTGTKYIGYLDPGRETFTAPSLEWNEYLINGEYSRIKGVFALSYDCRATEHEKLFRISGDGAELDKYTLTGGDEPYPFDIPISGIKKLKIELTSEGGILVDTYLYK